MNKLQQSAIKVSRATQNQIEELIGGAHHEINNLSFIVSTSLELLAMKELDEKTKTMITSIEKKITDINVTLNQLREVVKDSSNEEKSNISLKEVCDSAIKLCKRRFENHHVVLKTEIFTDFVITSQKHQLNQAILSLLNTAHDSINETNSRSKNVSLTVQESSTKLEVIVSDSSKLLTHDEIKKIFQPNETINGRKGLSLLLVKDIIEKNGGSLEYKALDGKNSFVITFAEYSLNDGTLELGTTVSSAEALIQKCS